MSRVKRGVVLLETLVALTVIASVAASIGACLTQATAALHASRKSAEETAKASDLLDIVSLWPVADLERHFGFRAEDDLMLHISRRDSRLYEVTVWDSTRTRLLLGTTLYRREMKDARR